MYNFIYKNTTELIFGKDQIETFVQKISLKSHNILLVYGQSSVKKNGIYDALVKVLIKYGVSFKELSGIVPNPRIDKVYEGIELIKTYKLDYILALGGGSVIDTAKAIAVGAVIDYDIWDYFLNDGKLPTNTIPFAVYLTIPASGSEWSTSMVLTNPLDQKKIGGLSPRSELSLLDPTVCYTLPNNQIGYGITDIFAHLLERFISDGNDSLIDELILSNIKVLFDYSIDIFNKKTDYETWSQIMLIGSLAHNGLLNIGRVADWGMHKLEHELSAKFDIAHGEGLAIVIPAYLKYNFDRLSSRLAKLGYRVFNLAYSANLDLDAHRTIQLIIDKLHSLLLETTYKLTKDDVEDLAFKALTLKHDYIGNYLHLKLEDVKKIYQLMSK